MESKIEWSGRTSAYVHKHEPWQGADLSGTPNGVRKVYFLDAQWSTCPIEVEEQVKDLWRMYDLGNDRYMLRRSINDLLDDASPEAGNMVEHWHWGPTKEEQLGWVEQPACFDAIVQYLREQGVPDDEEVIIHWWW